MKTSWENIIFFAVPTSRNGLYYLNEEIANAIKNNPVGFYIYTKESSYRDNRYKVGQTINGLSRIKIQASADESIVIVGWIPSECARISGYDQFVHEELHKQGKCDWLHKLDPKSAPGKEWSRFPEDNPEQIWSSYLEGKVTKVDLELSAWQMEGIDQIFSFLSEGKKKIMAEWAARFGKTSAYLALFSLHEAQVMVVGAYYLSSFNSFENEIKKYNQFNNFKVLDLSDSNFKQKFEQSVSCGDKVVVLASLCGGKNNEINSSYIQNFKNKIVVIDEADYGAHTKNVLPLVEKLGESAPIILTTGTNVERAAKEHKIDALVRYSYFDMLLMRDLKEKIKNVEILEKYKRACEYEKKLPLVNFYRLDWSPFVELTDDEDFNLNPSFAKASKDVQKCHGYWSALIRSLIGEHKNVDANEYSLFNCISEDPQSVIMFVNMNKPQQSKLSKIAKSILNEFYDVYVVNGDEVKGNKFAEEYVQDKIRIAKERGKNVWIIASQMCQRSFSIPDINVALLCYDNGDKGATVQRMSRALTAGSNKKTGHIVSLSIDGNRDEKVTSMIMDTAKKLAEHEDIDIVQALRKVMKTLPIFQMDRNGELVELKVDEYSKEIFDSSNSHRLVVNKDRLMSMTEDDLSYSILMDIDVSKLKKEKQIVSLQKGKTFQPAPTKSKTPFEKSVIDEMKTKLNNIVDKTNYCIKEIRKNREKIDYETFVNLLNESRFVQESIGINYFEFTVLVNDNLISKSLISILIGCDN